MDEKNLRKIMQEESAKSVGVIKEHFDQKFSLMYEHVEGKFQSIDENVKSIKKDVEIIKTDITLIKADLHKKVTYDEFSALEKRVIDLESKK